MHSGRTRYMKCPKCHKRTWNKKVIDQNKKNENDIPVAFMGISGTKLEMLFIKNNERSKGLGKQLLNYDIEKFNVKELKQ